LDDEELAELEKLHKKRLAARKRKEQSKPWGKKERLIVLIILASTILISGFLAASARNFKLPGLPRLKIALPKLSLFKGGTIIIGKKPNDSARDKQTEKANKITTAFREKTRNLSGIYALYVIDLKTGFSFGVNENEIMQAASLIKLPVMAMAIGDSSYKPVLEAMGKRSDNSAQIKVVSALGKDKVQVYITGLGMDKTSLEENKTTPKEIGVFFQKLWNLEIVKEKDRDELLGYLTKTIFENWIVAGIPDDTRVAHKYGREVHVVNDAGIVFTNKPFVLVIMTDGVVEKEADEVFPDLAKLVFEGVK